MSGLLALAWRPDHAAEAAAAAVFCAELDEEGALTRRWDASGLALWTWGRWTLPVAAAGRFMIVGHLDGGPPPPCPAASQDVGTSARRLLQATWGRYVAIAPAVGSGAPAVLRDPSGALEVFAWRRAGLWVLASDLAGLPPRLWPDEIALDWDAVVDGLARPLAALAQTPLAGVHAIAPGALATLGERWAAATVLWRPGQLAIGSEVDQPAKALAGTVDDVVARMTAGRRILVEVSGGLDSAIVAACWARVGRGEGFAVNYFADRPEGDERRWAGPLCASLGLRMAARPLRPRPLRVEALAAFAGGARPAFTALDPVRDADTARLARRMGADAILTGGGGDAAFFQAPTPKVVVDFLAAKGAGRILDPFVQDVARWLRCSLWSVLREAGGGGAGRSSPLGRFLTPAARAAGARAQHPWLQDLEPLPPAKRLQIAALVAQQEGWGPSRRAEAAPLLQPLLSQPVLELCLAIPAWVHVAGGVDRGLARRAFAERLPSALLERRGKGSLTSLYARQAAASLDVLRPLLLDGALAAAGVLDRAAMEAALTPERLLRDARGAALVRAAAVEAWVRHWQGRVPDARRARRR